MKVCIISDIYASYKNRGGVEEQMENTILYLKKMVLKLCIMIMIRRPL